MQTADASWAGMVPIAANHHGLLFRNAFVGLIGPESGVLANINRMDPIKVAFPIAETWYLELLQEGVEVRRRGRTRAAPTYWWWTPRTRWSRVASAPVSASARIWWSKRG